MTGSYDMQFLWKSGGPQRGGQRVGPLATFGGAESTPHVPL